MKAATRALAADNGYEQVTNNYLNCLHTHWSFSLLTFIVGSRSVSSDDPLSDLHHVQLRSFFEVIGHQRFAYTYAATLAVFSFKAAKQTLMAVPPVAVAITG